VRVVRCRVGADVGLAWIMDMVGHPINRSGFLPYLTSYTGTRLVIVLCWSLLVLFRINEWAFSPIDDTDVP